MAREVATEPLAVPPSLASLVANYSWSRHLVGEAGAAVHRLHAPGRTELYLKHGMGDVADAVAYEMARMRWLGRHSPVPRVEAFVLDRDGAWLLMSALPGRTAYQVLSEGLSSRLWLVDAIAAHLRTFHALPVAACPFDSGQAGRMIEARVRMERRLVDTEDFDACREGWTAEQVWDAMVALLPFAPDPVVTHGDLSLDNVLVEGSRITGLIDLGRVGIADRYADLAILAGSLEEFGDDLVERLLASYGIAVPDRRKINFHRCLGEFF